MLKLSLGEDKDLNFVLCVSENREEVFENLDYYRVFENVKREFNIARAKAEEETRYLNLTRSDLETFYSIIPYINGMTPIKSLYMENFRNKEYKQSDFWKYGISGDLPIVLVTAENANDIYVVKEILNVYEILRAKGIKIDLVILDYEKNVYERYLKDQIIQEIQNLQIGYLQNISGGIFLLNSNEIEDEELFKFRASIIINGAKGSVLSAVKELEEEYKNKLPNIGYEKKGLEENRTFEKISPSIDMENLKFYNGFGGFSFDR